MGEIDEGLVGISDEESVIVAGDLNRHVDEKSEDMKVYMADLVMGRETMKCVVYWKQLMR